MALSYDQKVGAGTESFEWFGKFDNKVSDKVVDCVFDFA
jgi:hypothetical protein